MSETAERGLALLSNSAGQIIEMLRNDLRLVEAVPGWLFIRLVDSHSRIKAMNFLTKIKEDGAAFDWELNVAVENSPETLHFSGGLVGEYLLIVGAANSQLAARLYEDMLRMNNEQTNRLRAALKENALAGRAILDTALFDEISRLNNDLVAMQRDWIADCGRVAWKGNACGAVRSAASTRRVELSNFELPIVTEFKIP
jgi:hypothetical protein